MALQPGGVDGQPSAESSYELPLQGEGDGAADDEEDEEEVADLFGDFDAEGPPEGAHPVAISDGEVIDATCASAGAAAMKLVWFFEEAGSGLASGQSGLATVAVRHATSGELLVAVPGAFKPRPSLPAAPTGVPPRGSIAAVGLDGRPAKGRAKVPVAFIVWPESVFESRSVFRWEDVQGSVEQGDVMCFRDHPEVWPDCGDLLAKAENLGFGETRADCWVSAASEAEGAGRGRGSSGPARAPTPKAPSLEPRMDALESQMSEVLGLLRAQAAREPAPEAKPLPESEAPVPAGRADALKRAQSLLSRSEAPAGDLPKVGMSGIGRGQAPRAGDSALRQPQGLGKPAWSPPPVPGTHDGEAMTASLESALLFREMRQELQEERAERAKKKQQVFGLPGDEDAEGDGEIGGGPVSSMKGIDGVQRLKESFRRSPEKFAQSIETKMARIIDEYPGEVGSTSKHMVAVKYVASFMGVGTQQAVGRLAYALGQIHRALSKGELAEARFLVLISIAACCQQCLDGNWHVAWDLTPFAQPPWEVWKHRDLGELRKSYPFSPLFESAWVSLVSNKVREEEVLLKKRSPHKGFDKSDRPGKGGAKGDAP